jgi:hypothetical protein
MNEMKMILAVTGIGMGWISKVFPSPATVDLLVIIASLTGVVTICVIFQVMTEIFQQAIWRAEKKIIRRFNRRLHWSIGSVFGVAICFTAIAIAVLIVHANISSLWLGALAGMIIAVGGSFGWAMFMVHARIANIVN